MKIKMIITDMQLELIGIKPYHSYVVDGNKLNVDPKNLILVTDSEELIMNRNKLRYKEAELTKTGSLIAKVIDKTHKVKKDERL